MIGLLVGAALFAACVLYIVFDHMWSRIQSLRTRLGCVEDKCEEIHNRLLEYETRENARSDYRLEQQDAREAGGRSEWAEEWVEGTK